MFIIEGSDNLGKTTAAKRMVELAATYDVCEEVGKIITPQPVRWPVYYSHMSKPNTAFDFLNDYTGMASKYAVQDRFHIGGMVWHEGKITRASLDIVQGRLLALGSIICVFYASDGAWFARQQNSIAPKTEMFPIEKRVWANERFREYANGAQGCHCHISYDVSHGFPNDGLLTKWLCEWYKRLALLPR